MKLSVAQEPDRISVRRVVAVVLASIVIGAAGVAVSRVLDRPQRRGSPERAPTTIGMLEQGAIEKDERGIAERERQEASLHAYRWRDHDAGIAEIPIERAMQIVEERGR